MFQQLKAKMNSIKDSNSDNWSSLSPAEMKLELFRRQKELLDTFLSTGAISQTQHDKSLNCLIEKWESQITKTIDVDFSHHSMRYGRLNNCFPLLLFIIKLSKNLSDKFVQYVDSRNS